MNKRIVSIVLTLIMLMSLIPAGAVTASAAGKSISEKAITVLKQYEGFNKNCNGKGSVFGYGTVCTVCTEKNKPTIHNEKTADKVLREELKELDEAVSSFAGKNGLSLSQGQHDALVLFSFENGTAWTTGSGEFQTAVKTGARGSDFLNAICWWDNSTDDDDRRMIEANMYLNGAYSTAVPSRFVRISYDANGGKMPEAPIQYYDLNERPVPNIVPTRNGYSFMGWYHREKAGQQISYLTESEVKKLDDKNTLYAYWQLKDAEPAVGGTTSVEQDVLYDITKSSQVKLYSYTEYDIIAENKKDEDNKVAVFKNSFSEEEVDKVIGYIPRGERFELKDIGTGVTRVKYGSLEGYIHADYDDEIYFAKEREFASSGYSAKGTLRIVKEYIDANGERWGLVQQVGTLYNKDGKKINANGDEIKDIALDPSQELTQNKTETGPFKLDNFGELWIKLGEAEFNNGISGSGSSVDYSIDVIVTVTNSYLRIRSRASASSTEVGRLSMGEQVRIVNTASSNGALWGQIADEDGDGDCEGWIALVYTNYESVKGNSQPVVSYNVIATATITSPVNGYVNVRSGAGTDNQIVGALSYKSRVDLYEITYVNGIQWGRYSGGWFCLAYASVNGVDLDDYATNANVLAYAFTGTLAKNANIYKSPVEDEGAVVRTTTKEERHTITNLTAGAGNVTWGKISDGWVKVTDAHGSAVDMELDVAKYYTIVDGVTVRDVEIATNLPSVNAARVTNLVKGVEFNVNQKYQIMVVGETIWGYADKIGEDNRSYDGWINLASKYVARGDAPTSGEISNKDNDDKDTGLIGTIVGADKVNVRIHHATYSKILGKIARGTTVKILGEEDGWYKIDYDVDNNEETDSWVVDTYVEVTKASSGSSSSSSGSTGTTSGSVETGLGIVANTYTGVNVRTAPGTGNPAVGKLLAGSTVEILEVTTYGASKWGRVAQGWICMDYVTMIDNYEILEALGGTVGSGSSSSTSEVAIYTGETANEVKVYKTTSEDSDVVRTLEEGANITLHEILTVTTTETKDPVQSEDGKSSSVETITTTSYWARVNDGYIHDPQKNLELDSLDEATYTVTGYDTLNVRKTPGNTTGEPEYRLKKGDQVSVTDLMIVKGSVWGFIEGESVKGSGVDEEGNSYDWIDWDGEGWISLAYCTKGAVTIKNETANNNNTNNNGNGGSNVVIGAGSSTGGYVDNASGYRYTGKVINTNSVNVRATASTSASITTTLKSGAALVIYETTIADNMAWGRCDAGWVYLYYVDLTPVVGGAVDARVVYNDNTIAYTDMNCSEAAGTYSRMSVVDIYEIVGKMARTDLGWVNTDNLL